MKQKNILVSMALSTLLLTSVGNSSGLIAGATEPTQLMNNVTLVAEYSKQLDQYATQLNQYETQIKQFTQQVNTDAMILKNIGHLPEQQWDQFRNSVMGMKQILENTQGMTYVASNYDQAFKQLYKPYETLTSGALNPTQIYKDLSKQTNQTVNDALKQLHLQAKDMDSDEETLRNLQNLSQNATGQLSAIQAANAIAVNQIQTIRKLQHTMMNQSNMMAQQMAKQQLQEDVGNSNLNKFFNGSKPLTRGTPKDVDFK